MADPSPEKPPLLSLIVVGKNDNYMGNYPWRFATALNLLVRALVAIGRRHEAEIVVVDWNSDTPLHQTMLLVPEARGLVRFIVVPPAVAVPAQKDSKFPNCLAHNVGLRRARGRYLSVTDADVLLPPAALDTLCRILEGRLPIGAPVDQSFLIAHRRQVPVPRSAHNPPPEEIETFLRRNLSLLKRDPLFTGLGIPAGIALMHRELWFAARGYEESLLYGGWIDVDLHLRLSQQYPWIDLSNFGVEAVHLEHHSGPLGRAGPPSHRRFNGYPVRRTFAANDESWGLAQHEFASHFPAAILDAPALAALQAAAVQARIKPISPAAIRTELAQKDLVDLAQRLINQFQVPSAQQHLLYLATWYAHTRHPRTYLEFGISRPYAAAAVAAACPSCEICGIDPWEESEAGGNPPIWATANTIAASQPQALTHYITGDPATALHRLCHSIEPHLALDLALLRTDPLYGNPVANAQLAAERLTPGGALLVCAPTDDDFLAPWEALLNQHPQWTFIKFESPGARTGLAFAAPPAP